MGKSEWGNCARCKKLITNETLGDEMPEGYICEKCFHEHLKKMIKSLEQFRKTKDFDDWQKLKVRLLQLDKDMGFWHDHPRGINKQDATWYDEYNKKQLQDMVISQIRMLEENLED